MKKLNSVGAIESEAQNGAAECGLIALNSGAGREDAGKDQKYRSAGKRQNPPCEFAGR